MLPQVGQGLHPVEIRVDDLQVLRSRGRGEEGLEFKDATITTSFILAMREITTVATVLTHINRSYQTVSAVSSEKTLINPLNTTCSEPNGTQTT